MVHKTKKKERSGPSESATLFPQGTIKKGNNGQLWVIKKIKNSNIQRWIPVLNAEINGYKLLTVDYLKKNIGKTINIYEWDNSSIWPSSSSKLFSYKFEPNGNASIRKGKTIKIIPNWLKTLSPSIQNNTVFFIDGNCNLRVPKIMEQYSLQVDSINKQLVSSNIINMIAYVKC